MHEALCRPAGLILVPLHIGRRATFRPSLKSNLPRIRPINDAITRPAHIANASTMKSLSRACRPGTDNCAISTAAAKIMSRTAARMRLPP